MNLIKGKNLVKLHNCFLCHNKNLTNLNDNYPKIKGQYSDYLIWSLKQYQINFNKNILSRNNFLMTSQVQNLSFFDIKDIIFYINKI